MKFQTSALINIVVLGLTGVADAACDGFDLGVTEPVALGGGQNNLAKPSSSNKRKAEDSSSTKTTTELPASSTEISDIKIKRQRKVE